MRAKNLSTVLVLGAIATVLAVSPAFAQGAGQAQPKPKAQSTTASLINQLAQKLVTPPVKVKTPGAVTGVRG